MNSIKKALVCMMPLALSGCASGERSFQDDVAFLRKHAETIVLADDASGARLAVVPAYQGRVMTSTARGDDGTSYGWINYDHVASGKLVPHINVFGGEDRFWMGPEGGQYAIFFKPGDRFVFEDWQTPAVIDTEPFEVVARTDRSVSFRRDATLKNYSGTEFSVRIDREVRLLDQPQAEDALGAELSGVDVVAYESRNRITNTGPASWAKDGGLLSVWILGMFKHGPRTAVVVPYRTGDDSQRGPVVNDEYFGKVPAERLIVRDSVLFFRGDGGLRSKIGLSPARATPICGSWDPTRGVLTVVQYNQPGPEVTDYVNSMWAMQESPYAGDVVNSYNDGPPGPGLKPLGPFYELETSGPALALAPGASGEHVHRTVHLEGDRASLDRVATALFGVGLAEIEAAFERP